MKRMVDNAQTLNQVAKYTDVVDNDTKATLQWEGDIEVNGSVLTKPKEIVEITVPTGGLTLTPDTSKRYHIVQGVDGAVNITLNVPNYVISWDTTNMNIYETGSTTDWLGGCIDGWANEGANIILQITNGTFVDLYLWFDEVNKVAYLRAMSDI